jgi:hypothetical protein
MNHLSQIIAIVSLVGTGIAASPIKPALVPQLPDVLETIQPSPRSHEGAKGAELVIKDGALGIRLNSAVPLTEAQWDAIAALHPKWFSFNDQALTDKGIDRLVALDPVAVTLRITPITGVGAAKFGAMKHLKSLVSHHLTQATPEANEALASHPALEDFRSAGDFCIAALRAPHLKSVELAQNAARPPRIEELAEHAKIESLSLFAHNVITVDDACMTSVAKIKTLKELKLAFTALTYEGGLKQLLALPDLRQLSLYMVDTSDADLQKFKAAMPQVQVKLTPMKPEYRKTWDEMITAAAKKAGVK